MKDSGRLVARCAARVGVAFVVLANPFSVQAGEGAQMDQQSTQPFAFSYEVKKNGTEVILGNEFKKIFIDAPGIHLLQSISCPIGGFFSVAGKSKEGPFTVIAFDDRWKVRWRQSLPGVPSALAADPSGGVGVVYATATGLALARFQPDGTRRSPEAGAILAAQDAKVRIAFPNENQVLVMTADFNSSLKLCTNLGKTLWEKTFPSTSLVDVVIAGADQWIVGGERRASDEKKINYLSCFNAEGKVKWHKEFGRYEWRKEGWLGQPVPAIIGLPILAYQAMKHLTGLNRYRFYNNLIVRLQPTADGGVLVQAESRLEDNVCTVWSRWDKNGTCLWSQDYTEYLDGSWGSNSEDFLFAIKPYSSETNGTDLCLFLTPEGKMLFSYAPQGFLSGRQVLWNATQRHFVLVSYREQ